MKYIAFGKQLVVSTFLMALILVSSWFLPMPLLVQKPDLQSVHLYGRGWGERHSGTFSPQTIRQSSRSQQAADISQPDDFASENRMVFESYRDQAYEIYASDGNGNDAQRLTTSGSNRFPKLRAGAIGVAFAQGESGSRSLWFTRKNTRTRQQLRIVWASGRNADSAAESIRE